MVRNEANLGLTRSLNLGLGMSRGGLIARQDADDISRENRLRAGWLSERYPHVVVLGTQARNIDSRGRSINVAPGRSRTSTGNPVPTAL